MQQYEQLLHDERKLFTEYRPAVSGICRINLSSKYGLSSVRMSVAEGGVNVVEEAVPGEEGTMEQTGCPRRSWLPVLCWARCKILGLWLCLQSGQRKGHQR